MQLATVESGNLDEAQQIAQRTASVLNDGGLVVIPTETVYGVAASAASDRGVEALRALKGQGKSRAFTVHLPDAASAERYADTSDPTIERLVRKALPGPITLLVEVDEATIQTKVRELGLPPEARDRIYFNGVVGLRCPDHPLTQRILAAVGAPVLASSANLHGDPPPHDVDQAVEALGDRVDLVIDGGRTRYAKPSTIVRVSTRDSRPSIRVEREGVYDERFVRKLMRWTMLVICSGNTCRSAMAQGIASQMLARQRGLAPEDLDAAGVRVVSAGVRAASGSPAAPEAVEVASREGIDLSSHRSRPLTRELIQEADVIYCMTRSHRRAVLDVMPMAVDKTFLLNPSGDVEDPMGSDVNVYERTAREIRRHLEQRLKEHQP